MKCARELRDVIAHCARDVANLRRNCWLLTMVIVCVVVVAPVCMRGALITPSYAARQTKPYDSKMLRLSEILGAVHYLRELCGSGDGPLWRDQMQAIIKSEGSTAFRRARLSKSFNKGYRSYSRTYSECTPSAKTAIQRFIIEGVKIGDSLVKNVP